MYTGRTDVQLTPLLSSSSSVKSLPCNRTSEVQEWAGGQGRERGLIDKESQGGGVGEVGGVEGWTVG